MALHKQEMLAVTLAKMLANKQSEIETTRNMLLLICEEFNFDGALLYEADWNHNILHLTQAVGKALQADVTFKNFPVDMYEGLVHETAIYLDKNSELSQEKAKLLASLNVNSAVVTFLADENGHIYSMVAFYSSLPELQLDTYTKENLEISFSILTQNITVHTYKNRINFAQTALEGILDNTGIDIYVNDFYTHDILYVNESMARPYGGKAQFKGRKCWQVLFPGQTGPCEFCPQNKLTDDDGNPTKVYTWDYQRAFDGSWFRVFSAAFNWADGRLAHVVSSADITDNKRNEELIQYLANYDALTSLPNRRMLVSECDRLIVEMERQLEYILFFDIDGFKNINDTLGHDTGDEFLVELGKFFTGIPLLKGSIYRNGGDEFVAVLGKGITEDHIRSLARFMQIRFQKPWNLKNGTVMCGISIGAAQYPSDGKSAEELLRKADKAMYRVKSEGGGGLHFASECQ